MADDRPQYQHGVGTIGGQSFHWGSGQPGAYWSIPYGDYPVTPDAPTGAWAHQAGAIPLANNVIPDPLLGRNRIGIMIHSGSSDSLDQLYTQGCFKVAPSEWPSVRAEILKEAGNGPLYLHVQPGGVASFTNTKTQQQVSVPTAGAPGPPVVASGTRINAVSAPVAGALAKQEVGPENAGAGAPVASSTGPQDPRQIVFNKLTAAGLPPQAALGALWSLGGEGGAGLNPRSYNASDPGGSIGYGQWNGVRRTALENLAKTNGTSWADPNTQADHIVNELTNKDYASYQPGVFDKLKAATTADEAARIWTGGFERPAKDNSDTRIKGGPQVATLDDSGNLVLGSATGGGSAPSTSSAPAVAAAPDKPWWQKAFDAPTDAQGNPTGAKSPFQQAVGAFTGDGRDKGSSLQQFKQAQEDEAPQGQVRNQAGPAPGARNVSPMGGALLPSVPQTYGQTINSLSAPLTWNSAPPRAPQMPAAGLQPSPGSQIPGISLMSVQAPQGIGYGVDPNIGYGYG